MKIVFCGPPHSGKSVFIANLINKMPTDSHTIIRACPDGEGNWSNNKNQKETSIVRKKGKFTKSFIDDACKAIDNQTNKIVLVDVGGVMSEQNAQVFKHCDSFIVLSSDEEKKQEWLKFGQDLGLECVGCLDSSLEGQEEIYSKEPFVQGKIVGLERGDFLEESPILDAIAADIVEKSKYGEKTEIVDNEFEGTMIDDTELGFKLGYGKEILTEDGIPIKSVKWPENSLNKVYQEIENRVGPEKPVKINGIRANFILCGICKSAKEQGVKDISTFDVRKKTYIPIRDLPKKKGLKQTEGLAYNIIENKENVFMDVDITGEQYSLEDYKQCVLPQIKEDKNLYLSGRMPLWLLASITSSYDSNKVFTFQPGKGFTCVSSKDERDLGTIVDGADGIDINQYFEDKKDKEKLPAVAERPGIFSKIKGLFANYRESKEKVKYIDGTIRANTVEQPQPVLPSKSAFQDELKEDVSGIVETREQNQLEEILDQEMSKSDIGG